MDYHRMSACVDDVFAHYLPQHNLAMSFHTCRSLLQKQNLLSILWAVTKKPSMVEIQLYLHFPYDLLSLSTFAGVLPCFIDSLSERFQGFSFDSTCNCEAWESLHLRL